MVRRVNFVGNDGSKIQSLWYLYDAHGFLFRYATIEVVLGRMETCPFTWCLPVAAVHVHDGPDSKDGKKRFDRSVIEVRRWLVSQLIDILPVFLAAELVLDLDILPDFISCLCVDPFPTDVIERQATRIRIHVNYPQVFDPSLKIGSVEGVKTEKYLVEEIVRRT